MDFLNDALLLAGRVFVGLIVLGMVVYMFTAYRYDGTKRGRRRRW